MERGICVFVQEDTTFFKGTAVPGDKLVYAKHLYDEDPELSVGISPAYVCLTNQDGDEITASLKQVNAAFFAKKLTMFKEY